MIVSGRKNRHMNSLPGQVETVYPLGEYSDGPDNKVKHSSYPDIDSI